MRHPDYRGGSIVNLMSSLIGARGRPDRTDQDYDQLRLLPASEIARARHVVLLVIDGLGDDWLRRISPQGPLARHRIGAVTTVFPPTTASAITTYLTGEAPQQHALTGWYMWLGELGSVLAVLPGVPRHGGAGYRGAGVDPGRLFANRSLFDRLENASVMVSPAQIARSEYNLAHLGPASLRPFRSLAQMFHAIAGTIKRARQATFVYAYWPGLDSAGHEYGIESPQALTHLLEIERHLERLRTRIAGQDTLLLVCADHGQVDRDPSRVTELDQCPELAECLRIPLCGEPRAAYCYLKPNCANRFERLCVDQLAADFTLHESGELIRSGLFGLHRPHPCLRERVGDYTLIARDTAVIHQRIMDEKPFSQIGVHGGLSSAELMVPLCRFEI
jgi:hypothetical protein